MITYNVDGWNNFCRVFEIPTQFPDGYCVNGGLNITFKMVDWFCPLDLGDRPAVSKEIWMEKVGPIESVNISSDELKNQLLEFLVNKVYVKPNKTYLVIAEFGAIFTFTKHDKLATLKG